MLGLKFIFAVKLDECQFVKGQRLDEWMSITLMNEVVACAKKTFAEVETNHPSFSVQSEKKDIWWFGAFEVPKENYETLA